MKVFYAIVGVSVGLSCPVSLRAERPSDLTPDEAIVAWTIAHGGGSSTRAHYIDPRGLFSISHPLIWSLHGPGELGDYLELVWFYPSKDEPVRFIVMLFKQAGEMEPLEDFVEWYQEDIRARGVPIGSSTVSVLTISGHPARCVRYLTRAKSGALVIQAYNFFIVNGRYLMSLTYVAPAAEAAEYEPLFNHMIRSFSLKEHVLPALFR